MHCRTGIGHSGAGEGSTNAIYGGRERFNARASDRHCRRALVVGYLLGRRALLTKLAHTLETNMKTPFLALSLFASLALAAGTANAKGCVEGAAVGGVAGHVAGHHAVAGAAIGCAVGHHRAKVKAKEAARANAAASNAATSTPPNTDVGPTAK